MRRRDLVWPMVALAMSSGLAPVQGPRTIPPGFPDRPLGVRRVAGVEESGFHNTEGGRTADPFRWTDGSARLVVPFDGPAPTALHVRLGLGVPRPTRLTIRANDAPLFDEAVPPQTEWSRRLELPRPVAASPITIEILSDTFTPSQATDDRTLGVCVRGITLLGPTRDLAGVNLAAGAVSGVDETGFHNREQCGDDPCRWTDGNAKVVIPSGRRWKTIEVTAEIPGRRNYQVRLTANGRVLFDDIPKPGTTWSGEFPIEGLDPDRPVVIELISSTIAPGQTQPKDGRTLGIRLRKLILRGG